MNRECGTIQFPIWLLGDSEPNNWKDKLDDPFDARHPIRHNIWTSIIDVIQDEVYRSLRKRIDTKYIYIRNAIGDSSIKPDRNHKEWNQYVEDELNIIKSLISSSKPIIVFTFGSFSYEFGRRAIGSIPYNKYGYWDTYKLGDEFRTRINKFNIENTNLLPLLHRSIAGGKFLKSHENFCRNTGSKNYFDYVGKEISEIIIKNKDNLKIWI
jgi:hypothetical protein